MKRKQRAIKEFNFDDYDFSDCVEITGDALYLINGGGATTESKSNSSSLQGSGKNDSSGNAGGGHEIANSHEAVANAKPGDYFYRDDGSKQVVNNADIKYEQNYLQNSGNNDKATQTPETTTADEASHTTMGDKGMGRESSSHKGSGNDTYTIHKGDTLSKIVYDHNKKYGTNLTVAEVAKKNGIKDPNKIYAGQQINLGLSQTRETQKPTDNFTGYSEAMKKKLERAEQRLSPEIPNGQNINSQNVSVGKQAGTVYNNERNQTGFYDEENGYTIQAIKDFKNMSVNEQLTFLKREVASVTEGTIEAGTKAEFIRTQLKSNMKLKGLLFSMSGDEKFMNEDLRSFLNLNSEGKNEYSRAEMKKAGWFQMIPFFGDNEHQHHQNGGRNIKFCNKDGREAIFDAQDNYIGTGIDSATYNYGYVSKTNPMCAALGTTHGQYDMKPFFRQTGTKPDYWSMSVGSNYGFNSR